MHIINSNQRNSIFTVSDWRNSAPLVVGRYIVDEGRRTDIWDGEDVKRQCCQTNLGSPNEMLQPYRIDLTEIVQKLEDKCYEFIFNKTRSSSASRRLLFPSSSTRASYPEPLLSEKKQQQQKERKSTQNHCLFPLFKVPSRAHTFFYKVR